MITNENLFVGALCALCALSACRVEPGPTDYASQQFDMGSEDPDATDSQTFLPGPDPFGPNEARLTFGPFYEGAASESIFVDDLTNFFFIFQAAGQLTFTVREVSDRIEGFQADELAHAGTTFWGMSIAFFDGNPDEGGQPRFEDLSAYTTLHISFKSSDAAFSEVAIGMVDGDGEARVNASAYGYQNDGAWHTLAIPLSDLSGLDTSAITTPLVLAGGAGSVGETLLVDNFYLSDD